MRGTFKADWVKARGDTKLMDFKDPVKSSDPVMNAASNGWPMLQSEGRYVHTRYRPPIYNVTYRDFEMAKMLYDHNILTHEEYMKIVDTYNKLRYFSQYYG
jgi:hypothetical protein